MAMAQSARVARLITARTGRAVELVGMSTDGDISRAQLAQIGGTGVFVGKLRAALLAGEADLAVHSLKDLPTGPAAGLTLAAVPVRDDPRDALAARDGATLAGLRPGARIGTGSPRRAAQLLMLRPDLIPVPVRGNAGTRLAKAACGELDAVVLACAGLARIGRLDAVTQAFSLAEMLPAPGQGALAVECCTGRDDLVPLLVRVDDPASRAATTAERSLLAALEVGCLAPVAAHASVAGAVVHLRAMVTTADGDRALRSSVRGAISDAGQLGREVAADLLGRGAASYAPAAVHVLSSG